jgi:hypothetical protein
MSTSNPLANPNPKFLPHLTPKFRLVFLDAPFLCAAGVGALPVYADYGPFRRWFRWLDSHPEKPDEEVWAEIDEALKKGMEADEGSGEWVGVLGFSQGAKIAASLMYERQLRLDARTEREGDGQPRWQFGVMMAGRAPLVTLSDASKDFPWMQRGGGLVEGVDMESITERPEMRLRLPTLHVHGLKDEGLGLHRTLAEDYCAPGSAVVLEWDGPHRIPIKKVDVERVVGAMMELCEEYGI